jgi:hypothetical protein
MALNQSMILGAFFEPQDTLAEDPPEAEEDTVPEPEVLLDRESGSGEGWSTMILGAFFEPQDTLAEDPPEAEEDTDVDVLARDSLLTPGFAEGRTMKVKGPGSTTLNGSSPTAAEECEASGDKYVSGESMHSRFTTRLP